MKAEIGTLHCKYRILADPAAAPRLEGTLDRRLRPRLAGVLDHAFEQAFAGDPAVYVLRRVRATIEQPETLATWRAARAAAAAESIMPLQACSASLRLGLIASAPRYFVSIRSAAVASSSPRAAMPNAEPRRR